MNLLRPERLQQHATFLGWLHLAIDGVLALLALGLLASLPRLGPLAAAPEPAQRLGLLLLCSSAPIALLAFPGIIAGIGLLLRRRWGRILALVVGFLSLISFPIGTALGLYTIWVLIQPGAPELFN